MKKIVKLFSLTLIVSLLALACKDNFSEQDFINYQLKQKSIQDSLTIAKMNQAGQLLSYTLQVLEDKTPVSGVAVVMSNPPTGSTGTATTDANGFATFTNVQIGANTFVISKTGYYSATFIVDFGTISNGTNFTIVNNTIIPIKKTSSNQVSIFPSGTGGQTATIKGTVTIETDLTDPDPEFPQGITLKANLAAVTNGLGGSANSTTDGQGKIVQYYFNTGSIGTAVVDNATGTYTMTVPASADGRTVTMIYPVINANQKIGYSSLNNASVGPTVNASVPTIFGPSALAGTYSAVIPQVDGVVATFSPAAPALPGQGLKLNFTAIPQGLPVGTQTFTYTVNSVNNGQAVLTRGSGYTSSPGVTVNTPAGGTAATATCSLIGVVTGASISAGGSGYTGTVTATLTMSTDGGTTYPFIAYDATVGGLTPITFTKDVGSTLTALNSTNFPLTYTSVTGIAGFDPAKPFSTGVKGSAYGVTNFKWSIVNTTPCCANPAGTGAAANPTVSCGIENINITASGAGYTGAVPPVFTFGSAAGGTGAGLVINEFPTQWTIALDNSGNTSPYKLLPSAINLSFSNLSFVTNPTSSSNVFDQFNQGGTALLGFLTVSNGNVVTADANKIYHTSSSSASAPSFEVVQSTSTPAFASVSVVSTLGASNFGTISGINATGRVNGSGYDAPLSISIAPVAGLTQQGTGGKIDIAPFVTYTPSTKVYSWNGTSTVTSIGSGYQPFLNMYWAYYSATVITTARQFSDQSSGGTLQFTVKTGDIVINNVNYGTGNRQLSVN